MVKDLESFLMNQDHISIILSSIIINPTDPSNEIRHNDVTEVLQDMVNHPFITGDCPREAGRARARAPARLLCADHDHRLELRHGHDLPRGRRRRPLQPGGRRLRRRRLRQQAQEVLARTGA